jgi:hypothetical protein
VTLEEIIRTSLLADATLYAAIGGNLFLVQLPQNLLRSAPFKALTFQRISTQRQYSHSSPADVGWCRFQFTAWAQSDPNGTEDHSATDVLDISYALFNALKTFNAAALPASPPVLHQAPNFVINQYMRIEPNTQPPIYKCILDVHIWFQDQ